MKGGACRLISLSMLLFTLPSSAYLATAQQKRQATYEIPNP